MSINNLYIFLFVFFIILIIAYVFGMSMINLIDSRLNNNNNNKNINNVNNINKNNLQIEEYFSNNLQKLENGENTKNILEKYENKIEQFLDQKIELMSNANKKYSNDLKDSKNAINTRESFKTNFDKDFYVNMYKDAKIEGFIDEPDKSFKSWEFEKKTQQVCFQNHEHFKDGTNTKCSYGVTNYADPKDLSSIDLKIFMLNYPTNMTLQDYINWLYCFKNKEDELPYNHLKNLKKLKMGVELIEEQGILPPPGYYYPPLNSKDYFDKLYNNDTDEISIAPPLNSTTNVMMPFNYDEYSEFSQNFDVKGLTGELRNDDIGIKKNIHTLHDFVAPKDMNFNENSNVHNKFRWKKVEN